MKIFDETKKWVKVERHYTVKILKNLKVIERDKLYSDLKYPSLHKYLIKELGYSEAESTVRVNAVRLMLKSSKAEEKIETGELSLSNAASANKVAQNEKEVKEDPVLLDEIVDKAAGSSTREFNDFINIEFKNKRRETLVLEEYMLEKFDRLRQKYGSDLSNYELLEVMLERELKAPKQMQRARTCPPRHSRNIPKSVKVAVYSGSCANCGVRYNLEYDHLIKHSHGGTNAASNIQMLCRSCNWRKEIVARQMNFFV